MNNSGSAASLHSGASIDTAPLSPTSSRMPSRFESITGSGSGSGSGEGDGDGLSESFQSTDTVRRLEGYGSISMHSASSAPAPSGSVQSPTSGQFDTAATYTDRPDRTLKLKSSTASSIGTMRSPLLGPDRDRGRTRPRKPPMPRRASSNAQAPQRGGVFSVDDAPSEIEAEQHAAERQSLYTQSSTLRRRGQPAYLQYNDMDVPRAPLTPRADAVDTATTTTFEGMPGGDMTLPDAAGPAEYLLGDDGDEHGNQALDIGDDNNNGGNDDEDDEVDAGDDGSLSDAESFTLKDRQQAINETHPFGIRLWKPALYKKDRSVQKNAEGDIHSTPGGRVSSWLLFFNVLWTLLFGAWLALLALTGALVCLAFALGSGRGRGGSCHEYGRVLWGLAGYLFYPFGKVVRLEQQEGYLDEDQGEGRSISEYEQWQNGDLEYGRLFFGPESSRHGREGREVTETDSLLGRRSRGSRGGDEGDLEDHHRHHGGGLFNDAVADPPGSSGSFSCSSEAPRTKRRLFGRGKWTVGRVIFFLFFYLLILPALCIVSSVCWFLVFWIPMGRVMMLLVDHLRRHPLALLFESDIASARAPAAPQSSIIVCTYRAVGLKYWKYTVDGTNIFLINLMAVVIFVIFDWLVLDGVLELDIVVTSSAFLFVAGLLSIIPLAYFIGQAVASISAQSSMGVGAAINAFFSTIVEVFLYCVALRQGKAQLVEGSIIGSIFAGVLFLPGISMCFGAIKRKTQRFNARSAGVTSTMLLFAVIAAFSPTLFYQIYGTHELNCLDCVGGTSDSPSSMRDCHRCYFSQTPAIDDRFYLEAVRPYCYVAASLLFLSYIIGLWFTLRTHAAVIWNTEVDEKKHDDHGTGLAASTGAASTLPACASLRHGPSSALAGNTSAEDAHFHRRGAKNATLSASSQTTTLRGIRGGTFASMDTAVVDMSTSVATIGTVGDTTSSRSGNNPSRLVQPVPVAATQTASFAGGSTRQSRAPAADNEEGDTAAAVAAAAANGGHGGHDAPNWSRFKSAVILMGATVLYAIIAEILVDSVDFVLDGFAIDEKFLGITLFALVPNTTEFLIGSAYALQVCLLQIPALVFFSATYPMPSSVGGTPGLDASRYTFTLLFPQWDMVTVILCVFLLSYMYGEGKSNYFKGSILLLSYLVVIVGYYFSGYTTNLDVLSSGVSRFDTLDADGKYVRYEGTFKTVGRGGTA